MHMETYAMSYASNKHGSLNAISWVLQSLFWRSRSRSTSSRPLWCQLLGKLHWNNATKSINCLSKLYDTMTVFFFGKFIAGAKIWVVW